jgi:pilus assembly protein CpaF
VSAGTDAIQAILSQKGLSPFDAGSPSAARELGVSEQELEEFFGHGPLRALIDDETVTEILVNGPGTIWFERDGQLKRWDGVFSGEEALRRYVRRLLAPRGRKADPASPFADAVLDQGVRVHVAVPPISRAGICLSIRKPPCAPWTLARLEAEGSLSSGAASKLRELVASRRNIFVCGGTGSGKTSLLSALIGEACASERIIALEDAAELRSLHPHFLSLEARPPNQEGEGALPLSRLLREALRMRPDRLVIGECRGSEALDLLLALHTGHRGSMGTIHSSSARDALGRLELLALLAASNLSEHGVKSLIASCIQAVVHLERIGGRRRVSTIAELRGVDAGTYLLRETNFP